MCSVYEFPFSKSPLLPIPTEEARGREGLRKVKTRWLRLPARGTDMRYGNHNPAGRQRYLPADLPRALGALPAEPSAVPGSSCAGRHPQNARLWHSGGGLYDVSVPTLPGRETRGVQLQEQLLPLLLQSVCGGVGSPHRADALRGGRVSPRG